MTTEHRSSRRTASFGAIGVIAVALVFVWLNRSDVQPPPVTPSGRAEGAPDAATAAEAESGAERSLSATAAGSAADTEVPPPNADASPAIVLEVRDSAARLVAGVRVTVRDDANLQVLSVVTTDGTVQLPRGVTAEGMAGWRAVVGLPGRIVTEPMRLARPGVVTIAVGDVGTVRVRCEGATRDCMLQITELHDGDTRGPTGEAMTTGGNADLSVAAGGLRYQLSGFGRFFGGDVRLVDGPRGQGDVVDVHIDQRTCRVSGQLVGGTSENVFALLITADQTPSYGADLYEGGLFSVQLPRIRFESIVFVQGALCGVGPPVTLDADERNVGAISMTARPSLGRLEVWDPHGAIQTRPPHIAHVTTAAGKQVRGGFATQSFISWTVSPDGFDCLAVPGITEVAVSAGFNDMFWEPRMVVIRDGGVFRVNPTAWGRVVVLLSAPGRQGLPEMWLEEVATKERIARRNARLRDPQNPKPGLQWHEFRGVPPGRYQVCAKNIEIVGGSLEVLGSSEQEITVSARPQ